jgi:transcriptional regulator with XRE-family HTH domain
MGESAVFGMLSVGKKLLDRLRKPAFRRAYTAEHVRRGVAYQIRALRDHRGWNQGRFAKEIGKPQSVVSRLEDPSYGKYTIQTLLEIASVFDVALQVRFVSFSEFLRQTRNVSTAAMLVETFDRELESMSRGKFLRPAGEIRGSDEIPIIEGDSTPLPEKGPVFVPKLQLQLQ